jgi:hypothetical protein
LEPLTQYHPDPDGQLRNVDELRDLVHELSVNIWPIIRHPVVQMLMGPEMAMTAEVAVQLAHNMVCPAEAKEVEGAPEAGEGKLGRPDLLSDADLRELFKNFE